MCLGESLVIWTRKKNDRISHSSTKTKFHALAQDVCKGIWMKIILDDLKIKDNMLVQLYYNNKP